jgi:ERCC4-type nuclease
MTYSIIIDNRENKIINEFKKRQNLKNIYTIETLIIGDFIIKQNDKILLVIERKTWSDLNNSIMDGRYRNQKDRLIKYCLDNKLNRDQIMYLIEGNYEITNNKHKLLTKSALESACTNLQIRDGFRLYQTDSLKNTFEFLQKIINCLNKYGYYYQDNNNNSIIGGDFYKSLSVVKKDNLTPSTVYLNQLRIIPGLSIKKAESIMSEYPNLVSLVDVLKGSNNGDKLKEIKGIGPKLSEKIYRYIIQDGK